jgi:predicted nucleic acid-binding protein
MVCLDTNIVIYIANGALDEQIVTTQPMAYPSIVRIEALGYHAIQAGEERRVRNLLQAMVDLPLTESVIQRAIELRQLWRLSLGDAIVAATALEQDCELWTANTEDFTGIDGLRLVNPLTGII